MNVQRTFTEVIGRKPNITFGSFQCSGHYFSHMTEHMPVDAYHAQKYLSLFFVRIIDEIFTYY